jgi:protoporphyrin/coproporphyrin ferrochelatase
MRGLLLVNLGSPNSPDPKDVKEYLREFLNDPYVIDLPAPLRWFLVNVIILNTRPKKSAEAYATIWTDRGSPLVDVTQRLTRKVQERVPFPVEMGMRYGCPCINAGVDRLVSRGVTEITMLPLYPQYSYAASETAIVEFENVVRKKYPKIKTDVIDNFHQHPAYIRALVNSIQPTLAEMKPDLLLLSYHGIPNKQRFKTRNQMDYQQHCFETSDLLQQGLGLSKEQILTTFQSRLGPTKWIEPYTDVVLEGLSKQGKTRIAVASPSFTVDCLETLEEIQIRYQELFHEHGGKEFKYIPCLNDSDDFVSAILEITSQTGTPSN